MQFTLAHPLPEDESTLTQILAQQAVVPCFQPVFNLQTGELTGYEAFTQGPADSLLQASDKLFSTAAAGGYLDELEQLCLQKALQQTVEQGLPGQLFLNISAPLLCQGEPQEEVLARLLDAFDIPRQQLVICLSEQPQYGYRGGIGIRAESFQRLGFPVLLSGLGTSFNGLSLLSEIRPAYIKIDKTISCRIDRDIAKREFVRTICTLAQHYHCEVIAEGIETLSELTVLQSLGVTNGQGYLLGYPAECPDQLTNSLLVNRARRQTEQPVDKEETVLSISQPLPAMGEESELAEIEQLFKADANLHSVVVLDDDDAPLGVVRRRDLLEMFSTQYGRALHEHKQAAYLLQKDVLIVEGHTSLSQVACLLTDQRSDALLNQEIIITARHSYHGMGSLKELLRRIAELQVRQATHTNSLTRLPGSLLLNQAIDTRLSKAQPFYLACFDLNGFKHFNDHYGYARGDELIQLLSRIIIQFAAQPDSYIGHLGGDSFVVLFPPGDTVATCQQICESFSQEVRNLYAPQDLHQGGIWRLDGQGERCFYSLLSLAVGVVCPDVYACEDHREVAELAARAKATAKRSGSNCVFFSDLRHL